MSLYTNLGWCGINKFSERFTAMGSDVRAAMHRNDTREGHIFVAVTIIYHLLSLSVYVS